jgi:hypothetical protein
MILQRNLIQTALLACCLTFFTTNVGFCEDQDEQKALEAAHSRLVAALDQTEDLFYKTVKNDAGSTSYTIVWEQDGEISKIVMVLNKLGTYRNAPVYGLLAFSIVAETEKSFPPAVIKLATVKTDSCGLGAFTMPESFDTVYVTATMPSDTLTASQIWITCAYIHENRLELKKEIEQIVAASAR